MHFLAFGAIALLVTRMLNSPAAIACGLLAVFLLGLLVELLQNLVPGRKFCWRDLLANSCGILVLPMLNSIVPYAS
jgi:VanZ family protein